jgi:hypothetical protein
MDKIIAPFAFLGGSTMWIIEFIKGANLFLGLVGGVLMVLGGYYTFRLKKREWDEKAGKQ